MACRISLCPALAQPLEFTNLAIQHDTARDNGLKQSLDIYLTVDPLR